MHGWKAKPERNLLRGSNLTILFPPAETYESDDGQRSDHEVYDAGVECLCRFMTKLLGCFCAYRTLGFRHIRSEQQKTQHHEANQAFHMAKLKTSDKTGCYR